MKLLLYQFELVYLPEKYMYIADLLSRNYRDNVKERDDDESMDNVHTVKIG